MTMILLNFLGNFSGVMSDTGGTLDQSTLRRSLFMLSGEDAIWHLLKVSAGLDSLIVGEGQILAQVKRAYEHGIEPENLESGKPAGQHTTHSPMNTHSVNASIITSS